ncbi:hypothetical protein BN946_scf184985.g85 [Trametes cinnabarina]|uniref:Uncharacterized protein n=1 Tax=Pycnoporus cinnabarinus TaxID=5643 RepID=A0A060SEK9_PYCCI|nr:hypothetical protein BN946_scf184985.g85 [Trametes cinnabarina]
MDAFAASSQVIFIYPQPHHQRHHARNSPPASSAALPPTRPRDTTATASVYKHQEFTFCGLHSGRPTYQTREHVLLECDYYTRRFRFSAIEDLLQSMDPFYEIERFLKDNPTAFTFDDLPQGYF